MIKAGIELATDRYILHTTVIQNRLQIVRNIPIVGMVVTISPSLSLYNMVVLPAASRPTISIRISFFANNRLNSLVKDNPIFP